MDLYISQGFLCECECNEPGLLISHSKLLTIMPPAHPNIYIIYFFKLIRLIALGLMLLFIEFLMTLSVMMQDQRGRNYR